jgi:hypothetical protein
MTEQIRLAIHFPAYGGQIAAEHARMWMGIGNTLGGSQARFELVSYGYVDVNPVDRARNMCVAAAMLKNANWLVMIDADTWIDDSPDEDAGFQLLRMISDADRIGATLVGAPVIKRTTGIFGDERNLAVYEVEENEAGLIYKPLKASQLPRRLLEVDAIGAACCAINLHRVADWNLNYQFTPRISEDLGMCRQIFEAAKRDWKPGGDKFSSTIYVDGRVQTGHLSRAYPLLTRAL